MQPDRFAMAKDWDKKINFSTRATLLVGAFAFAIKAIGYSFFQDNGNARLLSTAYGLLAALYAGMWQAFRKFGMPTRKYKLVVAAMVVPIVVTVLAT